MTDGDGGSGFYHLTERAQSALHRAWGAGVPSEASALHARWWQLETWLRSLAYVELKAQSGSDWLNRVPEKSKQYARNEARLAYMTSPDAELLLSYIDVGDLFGLIDKHWELFEHALIDQTVWRGRTRELRQIRHRMGHCRRPHTDDLDRVEQTLRDLEQGAFRALSSFNTRQRPDQASSDPMVAAWVRGSHPDASRLIAHAERNYETYFDLRFSRRPWAEPYSVGEEVSGRPGYLWHARFVLRDGGGEIDPVRFWRDYLYDQQARSLLVFVSLNSHVDLSFAAVDDPATIADAVGRCFDGVLGASRGARVRSDWPNADWDKEWLEALQRSANLDPRLQVTSPWAIVDATTTPVTIFGA